MQRVLTDMVRHLQRYGSNGEAVNMTTVLECEGMDVIGELHFPVCMCLHVAAGQSWVLSPR